MDFSKKYTIMNEVILDGKKYLKKLFSERAKKDIRYVRIDSDGLYYKNEIVVFRIIDGTGRFDEERDVFLRLELVSDGYSLVDAHFYFKSEIDIKGRIYENRMLIKNNDDFYYYLDLLVEESIKKVSLQVLECRTPFEIKHFNNHWDVNRGITMIQPGSRWYVESYHQSIDEFHLVGCSLDNWGVRIKIDDSDKKKKYFKKAKKI